MNRREKRFDVKIFSAHGAVDQSTIRAPSAVKAVIKVLQNTEAQHYSMFAVHVRKHEGKP